MLLTWITVPSATTVLSGIGDYSKPMWNEFFPIAVLIAGIFIAILFIGWIIGVIAGIFDDRRDDRYERETLHWFQERYGQKPGGERFMNWHLDKNRPKDPFEEIDDEDDDDDINNDPITDLIG